MTRRRPSRFARPLIVLSVAACAALAAPALAQANSTVAYNGAVLSYVGEDGVNNVATVSLNAAATTYTITDSENITTASPGCTGSGTQTVTCTATTSQDDEVLIDGLGGNDTLMVDTQAAPFHANVFPPAVMSFNRTSTPVAVGSLAVPDSVAAAERRWGVLVSGF